MTALNMEMREIVHRPFALSDAKMQRNPIFTARYTIDTGHQAVLSSPERQQRKRLATDGSSTPASSTRHLANEEDSSQA